MKKQAFTLSKSEKQIMDVLWMQAAPLSRSQIIENSPDRTWKESSIHILLNQLLKKNAIEVDGFVKTGKNYGRTFKPTLTLEEFQIMQLKDSPEYRKSKSATVTNLISALIQDENLSDQDIADLEAMLQVKKEELK